MCLNVCLYWACCFSVLVSALLSCFISFDIILLGFPAENWVYIHTAYCLHWHAFILLLTSRTKTWYYRKCLPKKIEINFVFHFRILPKGTCQDPLYYLPQNSSLCPQFEATELRFYRILTVIVIITYLLILMIRKELRGGHTL